MKSIYCVRKIKKSTCCVKSLAKDVFSEYTVLGRLKEQQEQSSEAKKSMDTEKMTQLEGIRYKVFMDRYSLKDPSGKPLEYYPEQLWARVARGIASVEPSEE